MIAARLARPPVFPTVSAPWRAMLLALLVAAAALFAWRIAAQVEGDRGIAPIASTGDFEVSGIEVVATGKNPREAREEGWRMAQRRGWEILYARTHGGAEAPELPDSRLEQMISAVVVEQESIGPRRYVATLGVVFDRARTGEIFGTTDRASRSAPMLVMPVTYEGGVGQLYEVRTPWQRTWAQFRTAESPIDYVRPNGGGWESLLLNAGQMGRRSRSWWRVILDEFGAADVVFPVAHLERQWPGGPVEGRFTARFGPDNRYLGGFSMTAADEAALPAMLAKAAKRMDGIYAKALADGRLQVDDTLDYSEQRIDPALLEALAAGISRPEAPTRSTDNTPAPTRSPATPDPTPEPVAPAASISVQVATPDPAAVDGALGALRGVSGVRSASIGSLAIGGTSVVRVSYSGDLSALAAALRAQGWQVTQGSDALSISR